MVCFITRRVIPLLILVLVLCQCTSQQGSDTLYLVHSSGLFVGQKADGTAVLVSSEGSESSPVGLRMVALPDSSVRLALCNEPNAYLSLGKQNIWSTYFLSDTSDLRSRYVIERTDAGEVLLRNLHSGKYLGTDGVEMGAALYSDKSGADALHRWVLTSDPHYRLQPDTLHYIVSAPSLCQPIEGWGVSLCWWARMCGDWSDERLDTLVHWMVSPEGLNWNIFRYNIGGGDDPDNAHCELHHMGKGKGLRAEMEGFQDERGGAYHWERDAGQRRIMLKIKEQRPDAIFEAFSNSAPWWMTVSGCCAGHKDPNQDNLKPEFYPDFAKYLVDVCVHYKEQYGIEFKTLEPFNEPVTDYWYANGSQEGCHFSTEEQVKFLRILHPLLQSSGLRTVIASSDETDTRQSVKDFLYYQQHDAVPLVGQWNAHTYGATRESRCQLGTMVRQSGLPFWMDEVGSGGQGLLGNLNLCQKLFDDMHYMLPEAWLDWQYVEEHSDQWCQVLANFHDEQTMRRVPHYFVRQQVTRFIKPGYRQVTALSDKALAAISPQQDTLVLVLLNNSQRAALHRISLPYARLQRVAQMYRTSEGANMVSVDPKLVTCSSNEVLLELPRLSIITLVLPLQASEKVPQKFTGAYAIVPQGHCGLALTAQSDGTVCLQPLDPKNSSQMWLLSDRAQGSCITTFDNRVLTGHTGSPLKLQSAGSECPAFVIRNVEPYFYSIQAQDGSAFGVHKGLFQPGTPVALQPHDLNPMAFERHWTLVPLEQP